ncbi:hypothetical protein ACJX0J_036159, partial [Zea mays]
CRKQPTTCQYTCHNTEWLILLLNHLMPASCHSAHGSCRLNFYPTVSLCLFLAATNIIIKKIVSMHLACIIGVSNCDQCTIRYLFPSHATAQFQHVSAIPNLGLYAKRIYRLMGPGLGRVPLHLLFVSLMGSGLNEVNSLQPATTFLVQMTEFLSVAAYVLNATNKKDTFLQFFLMHLFWFYVQSRVLHKPVLDDLTVTLPNALNICCYCA